MNNLKISNYLSKIPAAEVIDLRDLTDNQLVLLSKSVRKFQEEEANIESKSSGGELIAEIKSVDDWSSGKKRAFGELLTKRSMDAIRSVCVPEDDGESKLGENYYFGGGSTDIYNGDVIDLMDVVERSIVQKLIASYCSVHYRNVFFKEFALHDQYSFVEDDRKIMRKCTFEDIENFMSDYFMVVDSIGKRSIRVLLGMMAILYDSKSKICGRSVPIIALVTYLAPVRDYVKRTRFSIEVSDFAEII